MGLDIYFHQIKPMEIGYFRKVNFLVTYFSRKYELRNNIPITIDKKDIEDLIMLCNDVLTDHSLAKSLLPTCSGFFFGNTEYNDMYFEDVFKVYTFCKNLIYKFDNKDLEFTFTIDY